MIKKIELWSPVILSDQDVKESDIDDKGFDELANEINF